jgi:glucokinase-like ROK family protein
MKKTGDLHLVKMINKTIVLDRIRQDSPVSRARIAKVTGLTKATVSSLVNEWIESNLVDEIGTGLSSGGRKPVMLHFNGKAGYAIGIDLGVNYILAVLSDLTGQIVYEFKQEHNNDSLENVINLLKSTIQLLINHPPHSAYGVVGIGIGVPGICDEIGNVLFAPNLGWNHVPLKSLIEQHFQIPVVIDNEANTGAVGENEYGAGQGAGSMVYLSLGIGIGAGLMIKNELYRGASGFSGEIGHVSIAFEGKPCLCGNIGCWELYASENAILENARTIMSDSTITLDKLTKKAKDGDLIAIQLFDRLGLHLGIGLVNLINSFNPNRIIIGGSLASAQELFHDSLLNAVQNRSTPYPRSNLEIIFTPLGMRSTVLGACSFAIRKFFSSNQVFIN